MGQEPIACEIRTDEGIRTFDDNCMGTLRTIDACGCKHIIEPVVEYEPNLKQQMCDQLLAEGKVKEFDVIRHSYSNARMQDGRTQNKDTNLSPTLDTRCDCLGVCVKDTSYVGQSGLIQPVDRNYKEHGVDREEHIEWKNDNTSHALRTSVIPVTMDKQKSSENVYSETEKQLFTEDGNIRRYIGSDKVDEFKEGQMATTSFPNGYGHGPRTHDESITLNCIDKPSVKQNYRIRKLTPKECGRLMGVRDDDIDKMSVNQSNSKLYHLYGDSIVVGVLCEIFKQML